MQPKISIIIVTYNAAATLDDAIQSIIKQNYTSLELIIIDGNSTDQTKDIIINYYKNIHYWISEEDKGIYDAMNKGIIHASGDWLLFLGADDMLFNDHILSDVFNNLDSNECDFLYGRIMLKRDGKIRGSKKDFISIIENNISHQAIFYKKNLFDIIGFYDIRYPILSDYDFNIKIFSSTLIKKKYINKTISVYDQTGISNNFIDKKFFIDKLEFLCSDKRLNGNLYVLQKFHFYVGIINIWHGKKIAGVYNIIKSLISGRKKIFFAALLALMILSVFGFGRKPYFK
jgi:glycosyltransferase involved in cell wall biosynthesis